MNYSILFQEAIPDTSGYMIAGYVVFVVIMAIYLVSFFTRRRNLEQDMATLRTIESEAKAPAPAPQAQRPTSRKPAARKVKSPKPPRSRGSAARKRPATRR